MTWPLGQQAERLTEMKRENVPRASVARVGGLVDYVRGETLADLAASLPSDVAAAIDAHLRHFAYVLDPGSLPPRPRLVCPSCLVALAFGWGIAHGAGSCVHCGWPGRVYHRVLDNDGNEVVRFDLLLWAHPYEVALTARATRELA